MVGRVGVLTGASRGIGEGIALELGAAASTIDTAHHEPPTHEAPVVAVATEPRVQQRRGRAHPVATLAGERGFTDVDGPPTGTQIREHPR